MNNRRISEIQARIENCTNQEINSVIQMIKNRRTALSMVAGSKLSVGQKVQFNGRYGMTIKGRLTKINQKALFGCFFERPVVNLLEFFFFFYSFFVVFFFPF